MRVYYMRQKVVELIDIKEAMDNLAAIASINMESPPPIGIIRGTRIVTSREEMEPGEIQWLSGEGAEVLLRTLDITYRTVNQHLKDLYQNKGMDWKSKKSRDGMAAMMSLVGESVQKIDAYLAFRLDHPLSSKVEERESFKSLQAFYSEKFAGGVEGKEAWETAWHEKHLPLEASGTELKDFESVLMDKEYELFYLTQEDGSPYFSEPLLRNIKLTARFDVDAGSFEEDPFLKVKAILDRDIQASSSRMLYECHEEIDSFFKQAKKLFRYSFGVHLSKALLALYAASNARHLLQRTTRKSCLQYFYDFHQFLRLAMKSPEYQKWLAYPPSKEDAQANLLILLAHKLCFSLVHRTVGIKQEAIGLIHRTMRRGEEIKSEKGESSQDNVWNQLLFEDEKLRTLLRKFPGGPLLKILEMIRSAQEEGISTPFDPWIQGNLPSHLFTLKEGKKKLDVLGFGAPLRQSMIHRPEMVDEFRGFLRYLSYLGKGKKHLLINLQDRNSWREEARSRILEEAQESLPSLIVLTLPKNTDFYYQRNAFENIHQASHFFEEFKKQLASTEKSGFYFPTQWKRESLLKFADSIFPLIHKHVFEEKNTLTRRMREDFIEIFYQILVVEAIRYFEVDSVSFTCKDGVDAGAYASGMFYGFLKVLEQGVYLKGDLDFLLYLFYWKALSVRERAADPELFIRTLSALETWGKALEARGSKIAKAFQIKWTISENFLK